MMLLLLAALAFADDPPPTVPVAPGESVKAKVQSYLVAEPRWIECIDLAQDLPACKAGLDYCTKTSGEALTAAETALNTCGDKLAGLTGENLLLKQDNRRLKFQRNVVTVVLVAVVIGVPIAAATTL